SDCAEPGPRKPISGTLACCARAASGQAAAAPPSNAMNCRRLMIPPRTQNDGHQSCHSGPGLETGCEGYELRPIVLGHECPLWVIFVGSARCQRFPDVRFASKANIRRRGRDGSMAAPANTLGGPKGERLRRQADSVIFKTGALCTSGSHPKGSSSSTVSSSSKYQPDR